MPLDRLSPGMLRTQIEIMQKVQVDNGKGGTRTSWQPAATPWAEVLGQDGREALIESAFQGISSYRIRIRWRAGLTSVLQLRLGDGTDLNIKSVTDPNGDREQLMIMASTDGSEKTG